jgi:hypothetical protein
LGLLAVAALVPGLAGCNTGSANDARRAQERDAEQSPVMPVQQATRTAQRYFPATATPGPDEPLYPFVGQIAVTVAVNPDGSAQGAYASIPADAGTAFVSARLHDAVAGQRITAIWTDQYGNAFAEQSVDLEGAGNPRWVALPASLVAAPPGPTAVWLYADEWRIGSIAFQVTGPGSAPQVYSELPTNPQAAAATQPPPTAAPGANPQIEQTDGEAAAPDGGQAGQ